MFLDGKVLGYVHSKELERMVDKLRRCKLIEYGPKGESGNALVYMSHCHLTVTKWGMSCIRLQEAIYYFINLLHHFINLCSFEVYVPSKVGIYTLLSVSRM